MISILSPTSNLTTLYLPKFGKFTLTQTNLHISFLAVFDSNHYRPQTKLREGDVSTPVCDSVHRGGGLCLSMLHKSHDQGGLCPGGSLSREVSVRETPQTETSPYGKELAVRILLECILV